MNRTAILVVRLALLDQIVVLEHVHQLDRHQIAEIAVMYVEVLVIVVVDHANILLAHQIPTLLSLHSFIQFQRMDLLHL